MPHPASLRRALALLSILAPLLVFGELAEDVWEHEGFTWDAPVLWWLHGHATTALDRLMLGVTGLTDPVEMASLSLLVCTLLAVRRRVPEALLFGVAVCGAAVLNVLAKLAFHRARPHLWTTLVPETDYGFPSGHAMGTMAAVAALTILVWRTRARWWVAVPGGLLVAWVGLSRVYLGVHFPSDVLAGWSASLAWVLATRWVLDSRTTLRVLRWFRPTV
ncbi:phosphatase PAP2 family protein [Deinococcus pimensis]|uniref:phosphatase PAP2 family protein n=1 Tax=Deinococcus pimensis TaxID=309888 RepID=UPI0004B5AE9B|nr:phosphatase PAP2 family protein [Deinococcus pimensis]